MSEEIRPRFLADLCTLFLPIASSFLMTNTRRATKYVCLEKMVFLSNEYIYLTLLATEDNDITYDIQSLNLVD